MEKSSKKEISSITHKIKSNGSVSKKMLNVAQLDSYTGDDNNKKSQGDQNNIKDMKFMNELLNNPTRYKKMIQQFNPTIHKFWSTQPVPALDEEVIDCGPILQPINDLSCIRSIAYSLPKGFKWDTIIVNDDSQLNELYTLLAENYVEDDDAMFRFDYPREFLKWALQPPGWLVEWHCGVRVEKSGRLIGFISAIPTTLRIYDDVKTMVEINFLCVHKKLRSKRLAPVLIREITRRVNLKGIFQAVYTAGALLSRPVGTSMYWHRPLNPKKLIDVHFSHLNKNMTLQRTIKLYKLPDTVSTIGFRQLERKDLPEVYKLMNEYLKKFHLAPVFTEEEFEHWFLPKEGIIDSFVVVTTNNDLPIISNNKKSKKKLDNKSTMNSDEAQLKNGEVITDFVSYYTLPSTVVHHSFYKSIKAAYAFYIVSTRTPWTVLLTDTLITAKNDQFDVFNALDVMDNKEFLEPLKFGIGDGNLQYYLYNWRCPIVPSSKLGLVLQ